MRIKDLEGFKRTIKKYGFTDFWSLFVRTYLFKTRPDLVSEPSIIDIDMRSNLFDFDNIGELYEIGLAFDNQITKKQLGKYYTPKDTCQFMAQKTVSLLNPRTDNLADVCCGTGNLVIEVLSMLGQKKASEIIKNGRLFLYDLDKNAIMLAVMKITILFVPKGDTETFARIDKLIHVVLGNFLSDDIHLPEATVVISNPPYGKLPSDIKVWDGCETLSTNEMYAIFMDKITTESKKCCHYLTPVFPRW